jgi:leader peptidase (prepilin peptidase)/N-methyltransferase
MIAALAFAAATGGIVGRAVYIRADRLVRDSAVAGTPVAAASRRVVGPWLFEVVTAALCALAWWSYGPTPLLVSRVVFGCGLILLFTVDFERHQLPNAVTLPGVAMGIGFSFITEPGWFASLVGTVAGGGILWIMSEVSHRLRGASGVGMGDVKMLAMIGAFIGWKLMLVALVVALLSASMMSIGLMATRRGAAPRALPFGTFLAPGAAVAVAVGPMLIDWYWRLW